jgi:Family of unknown function (DUF6868)
MQEPTSAAGFFETLARVLLRCWIFNFLLLLFWVAAFALAGDSIYRIHGRLFGISQHELDVIFYCGIGLLKLCVLVFFFFPWLAIRLVLGNYKR